MCYYCNSPVDNAEHALFVCEKWGAAREASRAKQQGGPVEIASGPAPTVLRLRWTWLSVRFGGGTSFVPPLAGAASRFD